MLALALSETKPMTAATTAMDSNNTIITVEQQDNKESRLEREEEKGVEMQG
jgi:hypothetical protein